MIAKKIYKKIKERWEKEEIEDREARYQIACLEASEGKEIWNANEGASIVSIAPDCVYRFEDGSYLRVSYGGIEVLSPEECKYWEGVSE